MIRLLAYLAVGLWAVGCVSGAKLRAESEVLRHEVERARRSGAMRCAPRELATAEANLDFALGELSQGNSGRAETHIRQADTAAKQALTLSKECGPKQVLVKESPQKPLVVQIEEVDTDGDGVFDKDDACPAEAEDQDGFKDTDGCPDPDNDDDGVPDAADRCPIQPGPIGNQGCPMEAIKDRDNDTIPDAIDRCLDVPEDFDGYQDEDGCPEPDNDDDGLLDGADRCPNQRGPIQNLGCPVVDRDEDGVDDAKDRCPDEPEDKDGFKDDDGCPDLDNDNDGLPDGQDECRDEAGPAENRGCPDRDRDGDTISDRLDECPDEPGVPEERGCPKKYKMVIVRADRIEIKKQIRFASGSHKIVGKESFDVLRDVAQALKDNPRIKKIRIEGHTDAVGSDDTNLRLSQRRADSVKAALLTYQIDPGRMDAVGFGESRPIAPNETAAGRAENRRTEFNIVEQ